MSTEETRNRPVAVRSYSRRQIVRSVTAGGAVMLGMTSLAAVPVLAKSQGQSMGGRPAQEAAVHDTMRRLWEDHIVWTRGFIVSFVAGQPDLDATTQRLLRNQVDIGNAVKPFVGDAAGDRLSALLTEHILGAARLLAAAKANDTAAVQQASAAWYANADAIAAFLSGLNPRAWPLTEMQDMMHQHLDLTLAEAVAQLGGDWTGSIAAYDRVHDEILQMADMLAAGLVGRGQH